MPWNPGVGHSRALFHTVYSLCDPQLPEDEWWTERLSLLTDAQRKAVAEFVRWAADTLAGDDDEVRLRTTAELGLTKYWGAYAP